MLQALGYGFYDAQGKSVQRGAKGLEQLVSIDDAKVLPFAVCEFFIACDVTNPLCGAQGCNAIYGPQKGATPEMIRQMDDG